MTRCRVYSAYYDQTGTLVYEDAYAEIQTLFGRVDRPCIGDSCLETQEPMNWFKLTIYLWTPEMQHWRSAAVTLAPKTPGNFVIALPPRGFGHDHDRWLVVDASDWPEKAALAEKIPVTEEDNWSWIVFIGKPSGQSVTASLRIGFGYPEERKVNIVCYHEVTI